MPKTPWQAKAPVPPKNSPASGEGANLPAEGEDPATTQEEGNKEESRRLALWAKRDREQRRREENLKAGEADLRELAEIRRLVKDDKLAALTRLGIDYEELTDLYLEMEGRKPSELDTLKAEVQSLRQRDEETSAKAKRDADNRAIAEVKDNIRKAIDADGDEFPLVKALGRSDEVWELMTEAFQATGTVLEPKRAARMLEERLAADADSFETARRSVSVTDRTPSEEPDGVSTATASTESDDPWAKAFANRGQGRQVQVNKVEPATDPVSLSNRNVAASGAGAPRKEGLLRPEDYIRAAKEVL